MAKPVLFEPDESVPFKKSELDSELVQTLKTSMSINNLFDMQNKMLSHLLHCKEYGRYDDIVLCSPTGSGKTLAYALPILQILKDRVIPRLRAIIVVPTRDLATQVTNVFKTLANGTDLSISVVMGATSTALESRSLKGCEILIATPGRLVQHIQNDEHLDLSHVRYLVLDESDRLLQESYDRWLEVLMPLLGKPPRDQQDDENSLWRPTTGLLALAIVPSIASMAGSSFGTVSDERISKILVSATQSQNPTHMVHLDMREPTVFQVKPHVPIQHGNDSAKNADDSSEQKYNLPSKLQETGYVVKKIQEKPAALLSLLGWTEIAQKPSSKPRDDLGNGTKLIFTNSVESAHRLCRLLEVCSYSLGYACPIFEMSRELSAERRREVVDFVKQQPHDRDDTSMAPIVVCSDVLSRGMDIFTVDCVINYDAPVHIRTYLHRAGRTARAGRPGTVLTLLLEKQMHHFRQMVYNAERGDKSVKTFNMRSAEFFTSHVKHLLSFSLSSLKRVLKREKLHLLSREQALPAYALYELSSRAGSADDVDDGVWDEDNVHDADFIDRELHGKEERKRKHRSDDVYDEPQNEAHDTEDMDDGEQDNLAAGDDTLSDLLYAQIAKNVMLNG